MIIHRPLVPLALVSALTAQAPPTATQLKPVPTLVPKPEPRGPKLLAGPVIVRDEKTGKDIVLNFSNAKVLDVVQQVARVLGLNYVVDPAVKDVSIRLFMNGRLEKDCLLDILGLALKLHGVSLVKNGDFIEVVPLSSTTTRSAIPLYFGTQPPENAGDSFVVAQIIPLKYLDTESFAGFAKEFMSQDGRLIQYKGRNLVIVMDYVQHLKRVLDYVEWMDRSPFNQKKIALFKLKGTSPDRLLKELEPVLKAQNVPVGTGALQLIPINSLNAVFLVSQAEEWIPEVKAWVDRFDQAPPRSEDGEFFVLHVRFAKAETIYPLLAQVLKLPGGMIGGSRSASGLPASSLGPARQFGTPTSPLGSALSSFGTTSSTLGMQSGSSGEPTPTQSSTATLHGLTAANPGAAMGSGGPPTLTSTPGASLPVTPSNGGPLSNGASVTVDPDNNALLIFGTRKDYSLIESAVEKLDRMPRQVLIEATIMDLSMAGDFEFGLSGFLQKRYNSADTNLAGDSTALANDYKIVRPDSTAAFTYTGLFTSRLGLVNLILSAHDSKKNVNVVSQPRIWALDNRPSRLLVQDQIPIPVNTYVPGTGISNGSGNGYTVTNAQYLDTGLNLTVTPHINGNGVIRLEIQQEISSSSGLETLGSGSAAIQAPRVSRRSLTTEMVAPSGSTVILGGLVSQTTTHTTDGLPFINRIPFLRNLVGTTSRANQKSELVILLTPQVVVDAEALDQVTLEVRKRVEQAIDRMSGPFDTLLPPKPRSATPPQVPREIPDPLEDRTKESPSKDDSPME